MSTTQGWLGRIIPLSAEEDAALRERAISVNMTADSLYGVALKIALARWAGEDGDMLLKRDLMLYKLSKP